MTEKSTRAPFIAVFTILLVALISSPVTAAKTPDHTETKVTSTITKVHDGDTVK